MVKTLTLQTLMAFEGFVIPRLKALISGYVDLDSQWCDGTYLQSLLKIHVLLCKYLVRFVMTVDSESMHHSVFNSVR